MTRVRGKRHLYNRTQIYSQAFTRILRQAGLPHIRFHDMRHSHASLLLQAGVHPKVVSERLGHASVAFTLDIYSHVVPGIQEAAAERFDRFISSVRVDEVDISKTLKPLQNRNVAKMLPKGGSDPSKKGGFECEPHRSRTCNLLIKSQQNTLKQLNKLSVSQLAELSNLSKSYISQVKHGKRAPSPRLLEALTGLERPKKPDKDYLELFLQSRQARGVSPRTLRYYQERLSKFIARVNYISADRQEIEKYLNSIPPNRYGLATRHASYRAIKVFYRWLSTEYELPNPVTGVAAPILGKPILPSLKREQVRLLIEQAETVRDKAIIALFTESGLRLSELVSITPENIDWDLRIIRIVGKGRKEAYAPYGELTEKYLKSWLRQYQPNGSLWGLNQWGVASMLRRLQAMTGLPCNPHTFRRTFACLLRKAGVDTMTIKDLGRWESLEMVQRYTRSVNFQDSLRFYKAPLSWATR